MGNIEAFADEAGFDGVEEEIDTLALVYAEERLDDKREVILNILKKEEDGLIGVLDALDKQMGEVFVVVEEEVEGVLHRQLEVVADTHHQKLKNI